MCVADSNSIKLQKVKPIGHWDKEEMDKGTSFIEFWDQKHNLNWSCMYQHSINSSSRSKSIKGLLYLKSIIMAKFGGPQSKENSLHILEDMDAALNSEFCGTKK